MAIHYLSTPQGRRFGGNEPLSIPNGRPCIVDLAACRAARVAEDDLAIDISAEDRENLERRWGPLGGLVVLYVEGVRLVGLSSNLPETVLDSSLRNLVSKDQNPVWLNGRPVLQTSAKIRFTPQGLDVQTRINMAPLAVDVLVGRDLAAKITERHTVPAAPPPSSPLVDQIVQFKFDGMTAGQPSRKAQAQLQMASLSPLLTIVHDSWSVHLAGVDLIGCVINEPFTIISPRFYDLVAPAPARAGRDVYRHGLPVMRGLARLGGARGGAPIDCPIEIGVIDGFDIWIGSDLAQLVGGPSKGNSGAAVETQLQGEGQ